MKLYLFIYFILSFLGSQAASIAFSSSPLEDYRAYVKGICAATSIDCDLSTMSSCWDDTSAAGCLTMMYQAYVSILNSTPKESSAVLRDFFTEKSSKYVTPIAEAIRCEESLPYALAIYEKISSADQDFKGFTENMIRYAAIRPEDCFTKVKNAVALHEQGNFEALGLVDGNFMSQAKVLKEKDDSDWRKNAKNGRRLLFKGMCQSLGLDCPMESFNLNAMDEENSARELQFLYEWFGSVANRPKETGAKNGVEFLLGKGMELLSQIPMSAIEIDEDSIFVKALNQKIGYDAWGREWYEAMIAFTNEVPENAWHYKVSEYLLMEKNDLIGVGVILGLDWYHVSQWKHARVGKEEGPDTSDL